MMVLGLSRGGAVCHSVNQEVSASVILEANRSDISSGWHASLSRVFLQRVMLPGQSSSITVTRNVLGKLSVFPRQNQTRQIPTH